MKKIKILYIITKSDIGGAQKYVADLAGRISAADFEAKILYGGSDLRWLSNRIMPWALFFNDWMAVAELTGILRREQPDFIHLNSSKAGVIGTLAAALHNFRIRDPQRKTKVVFTAHGWVFNPTNRLPLPVRWFYEALHRTAARFQDKIICVSEYDYRLALSRFIAPQEKLTTIHNGIDPNFTFLDKETARKEILNKAKVSARGGSAFSGQNPNFKKDAIWIGSVGRLVKEKNYETFIRAAAQITKERRNGGTKEPLFLLIGDGPELQKLKIESEKLKVDDRFFFIPPTGNDAAYLKAFDIFVMSSIKEGLPYILLEAMAAERPIVVTEAGGIPEMIKSHESGMMVAQKNPAQLAQAIQGLITNPHVAAEMGKTALQTVSDLFSLDKMISATEAVYEGLNK